MQSTEYVCTDIATKIRKVHKKKKSFPLNKIFSIFHIFLCRYSVICEFSAMF